MNEYTFSDVLCLRFLNYHGSTQHMYAPKLHNRAITSNQTVNTGMLQKLSSPNIQSMYAPKLLSTVLLLPIYMRQNLINNLY